MMKLSKYISFLSLLALTFLKGASAGSIVWEGFVFAEDSWEITAAYQVDDEVWLVDYAGVMAPDKWLVSEPLELDVDSILVTRLVSQYQITEATGYVQKLYSLLDGYTSNYDPTVGDQWIEHPAFGLCWVGYLPWVWLDKDETWAYVESAGNMAFEELDNTWWIWTADHGWFWTAQRIYPWKWLQDTSTWTRN